MKHRSCRQLTLAALCILFIQFLPLCAQAQIDSGDKWTFQLAPYAWLAGQNGTVATLPGLPAADIDVKFYDDVLGNINGALMLLGEARKGRFGVMADIVYTDIEFEESTPGPYFSSVKSRTKSWIVTTEGFYRLVEREQAFLDVTAGARFWSVKSELSLTANILGSREVSNTEDWFDPVVGLKGLLPIGQSKFYLSGFFMMGGFGAGSDFMWDANANLGYQWTETLSTTVGYRYLDVDYEHDAFLYDIVQDGIVLGLSWRF